MTSRRGFLAALAGAALDPDRLLWVPGRKLISIPTPRVYEFGPAAYAVEIQAVWNRIMTEECERMGVSAIPRFHPESQYRLERLVRA
jgi:hypothetical protein